jgi:alpha-amylase
MDRVLVAMGQWEGAKTIPVFGVFPDGSVVMDGYSGARATVQGGAVSLETGAGVVLLGQVSAPD